MNGNSSYKDRQSVPNTGEQLFEEYCNARKVWFRRLGFDEKNDSVPYFSRLSPFLRNLPDYLVVTEKRSMLIMVKGTANIKKEEIDKLPFFIEWYNSKECPLYYAFCFKGEKKPLFYTPERVIELYKQGYDKQWSDGKIYRSLKIES